MENPLLEEWATPFETPPFTAINISHFRPAVEQAILLAESEIARITGNPDHPDFENTIASLDSSGKRLSQVTSVLFNLNSAETSSEMQQLTMDVSPLLTRFSNDITLNVKLFARIKSVYNSTNHRSYDTGQAILIEKYYRNFVLGGADLDEKGKAKFRKISEELSQLTVKFEENVLNDTNLFELNITDAEDLAGIPENIADMAALEAKQRNREGWIFTLHYPSYIPFMKYCDNRDLRQKMFSAYSSRAFHGDNNDNRSVALRIANLRLNLAKLLGYNNFAEMALIDRMADTTTKVSSFIEELHASSKNAAIRDLQTLEKFAQDKGLNDKLQRWDWTYYSEKLRMQKFNIDDEILRPYFKLENAEKAIFKLAGRLYGLSFVENDDIEVYHPDVKTFEVHDHDGTFLAILYLDYFPRKGKNGGAWMTSFREQRIENGKDIRPLISIVTNFTRPSDQLPSLLTFNEVTTFLHEFGHALHGMLSKCTFESLSGTNVARDFVELPSQLMENFAYEKEWMETWAVHFKEGERIPEEIINKIKVSATFNEGYACNRQLGFAFLDMAWHTVSTEVTQDIGDFESKAMENTELFPSVAGTNMSVSFSHIFGGGYAAGYYGYKWAEVLDADAFKYFKEKGIFNMEVASSFRSNILERGGTDKPMNLYMAFRGKKPAIDALLERSGLQMIAPAL